MRVGFLIDRWQERRGGAERALFALARRLVAGGHDVRAFATEGPAPGEDPVARVHRVGTRGWTRGAREARLARALEEAARAEGCERTVGVRHLHAVDLLWLHGGSHRALLASQGRAARGRHRTFVALERELLDGGGARAVACPSRLVRDELAALYPAAVPRLHVAPNGVDLERFHPRERERARERLRARVRAHVPLESTTPLLVLAARNPLLKGARELAAALRELWTMRWFLLVAGPTHARAWQRALAADGLARDRALVLADVDAVDLAAGADLCVLPTRRDACGMVVLEALAAGTPVVTTAQAGAAEAVRSPEHGEVVAHASPELLRPALASAIERVIARAWDPPTIRAAVGERDERAWLARVETLLFEIPPSAR